MPGIDLGAQACEPFTKCVVLGLCLCMSFARFTYAYFLALYNFARIRQLSLSMMPMIAIPFAQDRLQVRLGAGIFNRAFCLAFQTAQARLQLGHNIKHTF